MWSPYPPKLGARCKTSSTSLLSWPKSCQCNQFVVYALCQNLALILLILDFKSQVNLVSELKKFKSMQKQKNMEKSNVRLTSLMKGWQKRESACVGCGVQGTIRQACARWRFGKAMRRQTPTRMRNPMSLCKERVPNNLDHSPSGSQLRICEGKIKNALIIEYWALW